MASAHLVANKASVKREDSAPNVLIVDDRRENHRAFEKILENLNANFYNAMNGEEALSLALRHPFAVILMDVMMPLMDGFETAAMLRVNQETLYTPIIFITAADRNDEFEFRGYEVGAVDYLFKPIKPITLESKVKVFLELTHQRDVISRTLDDMKRLKERHQLLLQSIGEGVIGIDEGGQIVFSNPASRKILGYNEQQMEGRRVDEIMCAGDAKVSALKWDHTRVYQECFKGNIYRDAMATFRKADGSVCPVEYTSTPVLENGTVTGVVMVFQDISERKKTEDRLIRLAQFDSLTGLTNRHAFTQLLAQVIARASRSQGKVALLFLDLNRFKQVNDNLGHEVGDLLLREVATRLKQSVREGDILSRLGGDEFTIVIESVNTVRNAVSVAQNVISSFEEPFYILEHEIHIGASIGIALFPDSALDTKALLKCADIAMYKAKEETRSSYSFFTSAMQDRVHSELRLENQLRQALRDNQFELYYQPKYNAMTQKIVGLEALIRWIKKDGSIVPPSEFMAKAEEMGIIIEMGEWVAYQACKQAKEWLDEGLLGDGISVAINVSMQQIHNSNITQTIVNALDAHRLPAQRLELEVTESIMMDDVPKSIRILQDFHDLNVKISVDDFGTGYSSLNYLHQLPLDALKIDKSFVQAIGQSRHSDDIVKAILALAHTLNLVVVAEGVETHEHLAFLQDHHCDVIQGFLFSKPLSKAATTKALLANRETSE